jgi:hypothetical protein
MSVRGVMPLLRRASYFVFPAVFAVAITALPASEALAQSADSSQFVNSTDLASSADPGYASSSSPSLSAEGSGSGVASGAVAGGGQEYGSGKNKDILSHLTFEAGAGFNRPNANTREFLTWGGQFDAGVGYRFNDRLRTFIDYQFIEDKLTGSSISVVGAQGGHANIWSLTLNPEIDLLPKSTNGPYLTGGFGFYRKVTSYTDPVEVEEGFGVGVENEVVSHFSSNQWGGSFGAGFRHKLRWQDHTQVFAEVRYLFVNTPSNPTYNVLGSTAIIPLTLGVRF